MTIDSNKPFASAVAAAMGAALALSTGACLAQDAEALAKAAQNPIADMMSVPFQLNTNTGYGPLKKNQEVLNIQPVIPFHLNPEWNLITRTIVPLISQPATTTTQSRENGIGDIQFSAFLSPSAPSAWIWGAGAIVQAPTASDERLGQGKWGLGPTAVALHTEKGDPWVYGALINNVWSVGGHGGDRPDVNQMLLQPFVNYNFPKSPGRYLSFSPIITANWEATQNKNKWVVPLGIAVGQMMKFGKQPVNLLAGAYYNVIRPDNAPNWNIRLQLALMFPE
jgi:hypothetical protein